MRREKILPVTIALLALGLVPCPDGRATSPGEPGEKAWLEQVNSLEAKVEAVGIEHGPFTPLLHAPVMTLARMRMTDGDHEAARDLLRRAQNIAHRNEGVYTPRQLEAVRLLTDIAIAEGNFDAADQQQKFAFFTQRHYFGTEAPESLGAYLDLTDWYLESGQPARARRLLSNAYAIATGAEQQLQFAILNEKAQRLQGLCCSTREIQRAVDKHVKEATSPDSLAELYLTYADSLVMARKSEQAATYYSKAAETNPLHANLPTQPISAKGVVVPARQLHVETYRLDENPFPWERRLERLSPLEQLEAGQQPPRWFIFDGEGEHQGFTLPDLHATSVAQQRARVLVGDPLKFEQRQLNFILPRSLHKETARAGLSVELAFTVTAFGELSDIDIVESNAPNKVDRLVLAALKRVHFRPAIENGRPVAREDVRLLQTFASKRPGADGRRDRK